MSVNYADALSPYPNKGVCGIAEIIDDDNKVNANIDRLVAAIRSSKLVVVHTGAGISTAAGIPDFRGPRGVWTLEKQGKRLAENETRNFDDVRPTFAHRAIVELMRHGYVHFVVTQNIDGLHLRSGIPRCRLAALHGDVFTAQCAQCGVEYTFRRAVPSFGMRYIRRSDLARTDSRLQNGLLSGARDASPKTTFRNLQTELRFAGGPDRVRCVRERCRGALRDSVLDWQDELPNADLANAQAVSRAADLNLVLGSSLQIEPSCNLAFLNRTDSTPMKSDTADNATQASSVSTCETHANLPHSNGNVDEDQSTTEDKQHVLNKCESQGSEAHARNCIVNLQPTRFDDRFDIRIFERIDSVLRRLCTALNVPVAEDGDHDLATQYPVFIFDLPLLLAQSSNGPCRDSGEASEQTSTKLIRSAEAKFDFSILNVAHVVVADYEQSIPASCLPFLFKGANSQQKSGDSIVADDNSTAVVKSDIGDEVKQNSSTGNDAACPKVRYCCRVLGGSSLEFFPDPAQCAAEAACANASSNGVVRKTRHNPENDDNPRLSTSKKSLTETEKNERSDADGENQNGGTANAKLKPKQTRKRGKRRR